MIPVTSSPRFLSACLFAFLLAPAVIAAEPADHEDAPVLVDVIDVEVAPAAAPVAAPVVLAAPDVAHELVAGDDAVESTGSAGGAPFAGAIGAAVGGGGGLAAVIGTWVLLSTACVHLDPEGTIASCHFVQLATPTLLVALPALGAGLGSFVALLAFTDPSSAALVSVTATLATPVGMIAGGMVGAIAGIRLTGSNLDGGGLGWAIVGGGLGAVAGAGVGAASGGAIAGLLAGGIE